MPATLSERQKSIFDAVIREYIARAEPVASEQIVRKYRLPFSPATVRNELKALDKGGFLAQPHTSAGRMPTDKGYRFFISNLASGDGVLEREERQLRELIRLTQPMEFLKQSSRLMAHLTRNLVLAGFPDEALFYKSGLSEVMHEPEFSDPGLIHEFSALMDEIENDIVQWFDMEDFDGPQTFVGAENPIRRARRCGMIVSACATPFEKESVIALVGPKRMDYEHNLALLRHLGEIMAG